MESVTIFGWWEAKVVSQSYLYTQNLCCENMGSNIHSSSG